MQPRNQSEEHTCFQEGGDYDPQIDSKADVAIVYGINQSFEERVAHWREAGYRIHVMTGIAWGDYAGYVGGEWDGVTHYEDAQTASGGFRLEHGISQGHEIYYMMPSIPYTRYLSEKLHRVVDSGAQAIHLEEPEFWIRAGYGEGFQREWQAYYREPWQDPASSPDARFRSSKLQQYLYTRALEILFRELKAYARQKGNFEFKCYVPTHSLVNYAHWGIVSPESRMLELPGCDGLIGQVWTGTARTPTVYGGVRKQRTFEASLCEYAACAALVRGTGKKLWQLADPIEDDPNYCWDDYRANWECTVSGSLLVPESNAFEIMPWPRRIFTRSYPTMNLGSLPLGPLIESYLERLQDAGQDELSTQTRRAMQLYLDHTRRGKEAEDQDEPADPFHGLLYSDVWRKINDFYKVLAAWENQDDASHIRSAISTFYFNAAAERAPIPEAYATELQIVFNALADMQEQKEKEWLLGTPGIGLAISDTLMYQRDEPSPSDPDLSSLYGLALPLVKNGAALEMVQLERISQPDYINNLRVLLLSYEGQKPPSGKAHVVIAAWVRAGNALVVFGTGDAYDSVREWWNENGMGYTHPQEHLTEQLGLGVNPEAGLYRVGKGIVLIDPVSPAALAYDTGGGKHVLDQIDMIMKALVLPWSLTSVLAYRRGPYVAAAGMDESQVEGKAILTGEWVNLYDANLPFLTDPKISPDTRWLFYDLSRCPEHPWVIAAAGLIEREEYDENSLSFRVSGMAKTTCSIRARVPSEPQSVTAGGSPSEFRWDDASHTVLIKFPNEPGGTEVVIRWNSAL